MIVVIAPAVHTLGVEAAALAAIATLNVKVPEVKDDMIPVAFMRSILPTEK